MEVFPHPLFFSVALLFAIASGCGLIGCYWQNSVFLSALASLWHDQNTLASADQLLDFSSVRDRSLLCLCSLGVAICSVESFWIRCSIS